MTVPKYARPADPDAPAYRSAVQRGIPLSWVEIGGLLDEPPYDATEPTAAIVDPAGPFDADTGLPMLQLRKISDYATGGAGADGASAYEIAVAAGFVGDEAAWLASLVGTPGTPGTDGTPGTNGTPGTDGAPGVDAAAWSLVTNGDPINPEIVFFDGDVVTYP